MDTVAHDESERGELVLLRRDDNSLVLRVNGAFAMDSAEASSERALATVALGAHNGEDLHVLLAGLGLGYTLGAVLADARVTRVAVVEIEPALVGWHRAGLIRSAIGDPRVEILVGDIGKRLDDIDPTDVILLDVDNGPGFLLYQANAAQYETPFLARCADHLNDGGVLVVWSSHEAPDLAATMSAIVTTVEQVAVPVTLAARDTAYHLVIGHR